MSMIGRVITDSISFYVMEYIQGPDFLSLLQQKGKSWTSVLISAAFK